MADQPTRCWDQHTCQSMWVIHVTKVFRATQVFLGTHVFLEQYRGLQTKVLLLGPGDRGARRSSRPTYCRRDQGTPRDQLTGHPAPSGPTYSATRRLFPLCSIGPRSGSLVTSGRFARKVARAPPELWRYTLRQANQFRGWLAGPTGPSSWVACTTGLMRARLCGGPLSAATGSAGMAAQQQLVVGASIRTTITNTSTALPPAALPQRYHHPRPTANARTHTGAGRQRLNVDAFPPGWPGDQPGSHVSVGVWARPSKYAHCRQPPPRPTYEAWSARRVGDQPT